MTRILFVEKEERTRALLQCRLAGIAKVKSAPCMDVAWDKLISRKFDLILWNTTSDPAGQINLDETLNLLGAKGSTAGLSYSPTRSERKDCRPVAEAAFTSSICLSTMKTWSLWSREILLERRAAATANRTPTGLSCRSSLRESSPSVFPCARSYDA